MDLGQEDPGTPRWAQEPGEDTVGIETARDEQLGLSQAANAVHLTAQSAEPTMGSPELAGDTFLYRRMARVDLVCNVVFAAAAVLGIAGAAVWHAANLPTRAPAIAPAAAVVAVAPAPAPVAAQRPRVHVSNPFDATEVFEFPAETTASQARETMAELLLQRARDRFAQGVILSHAGIHDRAHGAVHEPPEILLTKLNGSASEL